MPKDNTVVFAPALIRHALIEGTNGDDNLESPVNDLTTGFAPDYLSGLGGNDTLTAGRDGADDTLDGGDGNDVLEGNSGSNLLDGGAGNDTLNGGTGFDVLVGGTGDDIVQFSSGGSDYYGGLVGQDNSDAAGFDTLDISGWLFGMTINFFGDGRGLLSGSGFGGTFRGFDQVIGSLGSDTIVGSEQADRIDASAGDDLIRARGGDDSLAGGSGDDTFVAGTGDDTLDGGDGTDRLSLDDLTQGYTLELSGAGRGVLRVNDGSVSVFESIEELGGGSGNDDLSLGGDVALQLFGEGGNDTLGGSSSDDTLDGGTGDDSLSGGAGDDVLRVSTGTDTLEGGEGRDTLDLGGLAQGFALAWSGRGAGSVTLADGSTSSFTGIEAVQGGAGDEVLTAGPDGIAFDGGDGADTLEGGDGADTLDGGAGDDSLSGGAGDDVLRLSAGGGSDEIAGGSGNDRLDLSAETGAVTLSFDSAGGGGVTLEDGTAASFSGIEAVTGGAGNDALAGGAGDDALSGAGGSDDISGGDGADTLEGGDAGDDLAGGAGADDLSGGAGNDTLAGDDGDDRLDGGAGDDRLSGGAGSDTVVFGVALEAAALTTTLSGLEVVSAEGTDRLTDIEFLAFTDQTLTLAEAEALATPGPGTPGGTPLGDTTPLEDLRAPVGDEIESRADPAIGEALFLDDFPVPLISIDYVGDPEAIGLLPEGYEITDGEISVRLETGVFLTTGGGPGTTNTSNGISTDLGTPGNALLDAAVQEAFQDAGGTNDAAVLTFTFDSAALQGLPTLSFDLFFGSDEFPEFADSSFVDIAAVFVNGVNYALFNNDPGQPLSIVGESINTPGNFYSNGGNTFDTEYDGFSALLTVLAPVQEGENTVTIAIADTGDSILDSGIFVGNLTGSEVQATGSFVNVVGTDDDDVFRPNAAPQIIFLNGGRDTVLSSVENIDNDVIYGWGDNDRLILNQPLEPDAFTVTIENNLAVLEIDDDGDGDIDSSTTFYGRFEEAVFVTTVDGNVTIVQTVGVLPDLPVIDPGTTGDDSLSGGSGDDQLSGGEGDDTLDGGEGTDRLAGGAGNDEIEGDFGDDQIGGGAGNDFIDAGNGADTVGGGQGNDTIFGGDGADLLAGGAGNDSMDGNFGADRMGASFGDDYVYGGSGDDFMGGGTGRDTMFAGEGDDTLGAGEGDDVVHGVAGNNFLAGGGRNDLILGGTGRDTINGGQGDDTLAGGDGADVFVFNGQRAGETDVVLDFEVGTDTLRLLGYAGNVSTIGFENIEYEGLAAVEMDLGISTILVVGLSVSQFDTADIAFM